MVERCRCCGRPMDLPRSVGARVRYFRKQSGMSQQTLGASTGLSRASVNRIEKGRLDPSVGVLQQLSAALGVDLMKLVPDIPPADMETEGRRQKLVQEFDRAASGDE